jgi:hypothetical protein
MTFVVSDRIGIKLIANLGRPRTPRSGLTLFIRIASHVPKRWPDTSTLLESGLDVVVHDGPQELVRTGSADYHFHSLSKALA